MCSSDLIGPAFPKYQVGCHVRSGPTLAQRGCFRPDIQQQVAEGGTLGLGQLRAHAGAHAGATEVSGTQDPWNPSGTLRGR